MFTRRHLITGILVASLLAGCSGNVLAWGSASTTSPLETPLVGYTPVPSPTQGPTLPPSVTPLMVLPDPGSPGGTASPQPTPTLPPVNTGGPMIVYRAQGGDTLQILAKRFGVSLGQIISAENVNLPAPDVMLQPGAILLVPNLLTDTLSPGDQLIPDSEVVLSPSSLGFDTEGYVRQQGGYLSTYSEYLITYGKTNGAQAVNRIALDNSLSPRILLAIIEYQSHWVLGQPTNLAQDDYPLGYHHFYYKRLFRQMMWASGQLSDGYYKWRSGDLTELTFSDGSTVRMNPRLNAGTAAIQYFFALTNDRAGWEQAVAPSGFAALYRRMFGDPWARAAAVEPMIPAGLTQPTLTLPFEPGRVWSFSGGPHSVWELEGGALAALDFAPASVEHGCAKSDQWVVAPAAGVVVRSAHDVVILDLDGDGLEQTGWNLLFLHIGPEGRVEAGSVLQAGDRIGHPFCIAGGASSGTHVHIARKYNGEWMLVDGPLPFNMDGWVARGNGIPYKGTLTRGDQVIEACACGTYSTRIVRDKK